MRTDEQYHNSYAEEFTVGASGAIMGVLVAFGFLFPNTEMIIFPIPIPVKAKWAITGMLRLMFLAAISRVPGDR